jgi:hypothetical protein
MHDANGKELKVGDVVMIPAVIRDIGASDDYCNVSLTSVYGRRPDGAKESFNAINTGVLLRNNDGDTVDYPAVREARPQVEPAPPAVAA